MLMVVENTPAVHNLVVCTLCSCYPWPVLGPAADLVQDAGLSLARGQRAARAPRRDGARGRRRARDPRLGLERRDALHGAAARPAGTDGLGEAELVPLITRDALIGVAESRPAAR